ncbi:MAG: 4-hydroxybenzoate octaprenyltransferase [Pseudomonadales bacterium]|nr:4-hydroxybenzoate octaprenyltransferase [Pseudomonadales bacterium]
MSTVRRRTPDFIELTRLNRPVGILLLLWPTWWALWLAAQGMPSWRNLVIFTLGIVLMRSAGCVINDFADRKIDGHVKRTAGRPIPMGKVSPREALITFAVLSIIAFGLVLQTNSFTVYLSGVALLLAASYPFMKRYTYFPQAVLGAAFGWGIPMAFAAQTGEIPRIAWLLFSANIVWTIAYDTLYAMVDRDDDIKIGVKSTAILFAEADKMMVGMLQGFTLFILWLLVQHAPLGASYYVGLLIAAGLFGYQQYIIRKREPDACFKAFLNNNWAGAAIFAGIALSFI